MDTGTSPDVEGVAAVIRIDGHDEPMHARLLLLFNGPETCAVAVPCQLPAGEEYSYTVILADRIRRTGRGVAKDYEGPGTILLGDLDEMNEQVEETEPPFPERAELS